MMHYDYSTLKDKQLKKELYWTSYTLNDIFRVIEKYKEFDHTEEKYFLSKYIEEQKPEINKNVAKYQALQSEHFKRFKKYHIDRTHKFTYINQLHNGFDFDVSVEDNDD